LAKQVKSDGNFESEFERLGTVVERLEDGNVPLEEMLKLYEEGMSLAEKLRVLLTDAELRVEKLSKMHEEMITEDSEDRDD
jgi:exodeoxyribonuclease VII small subunit